MATNEEIRQLAHRIWEEEGKPEGRALEHWVRATQTLEKSQPGEKSLVVSAPAKASLVPAGGNASRPRAKHSSWKA
jgi:hypothetical protein